MILTRGPLNGLDLPRIASGGLENRRDVLDGRRNTELGGDVEQIGIGRMDGDVPDSHFGKGFTISPFVEAASKSFPDWLPPIIGHPPRMSFGSPGRA